jgi:hypothetical protein
MQFPLQSSPEDKEQEANNLFISEMGFSLVIECLVNAKKPIIGHNMIYDLAFITH